VSVVLVESTKIKFAREIAHLTQQADTVQVLVLIHLHHSQLVLMITMGRNTQKQGNPRVHHVQMNSNIVHFVPLESSMKMPKVLTH
jgi:hypothetical protein